jgi:phage tail sheath protein FI
LFSNKERNPIDVAIALPRTMNTDIDPNEITSLDTLIGTRYDFIVPVQVGALTATKETSIKTANTTAQGLMTSNPSYFAKYVGWTLVYDAYNSSRVYLPNSIFAASVMLRTDRIAHSWDAPAGTDRGIISSGKQNIDIAPALGGRLYDLNINTIKYVNNTGNVIWGQKTAQLKNTARNRINVRRGLLFIEKNVEDILNGFLFKGNTTKERERVTSMVKAFMQTVLTGGGVQSFKVVCDGTNNNTSSNTLVVDLYVQPTYTIEFIKLNTIISASSVTTAEA